MKSFDILVDKRLIQSDLIVVNLPVRNEIAAYYWLILDSRLINHIIAEKTVFPANNTGCIALNATADSTVVKYESADTSPVVIDSNAEFNMAFSLDLEESKIEIQQELQEVSQKIERISFPISIGAGDMLAIMPLKSTGRIENTIEVHVSVNEVKNAIIDGGNRYRGVIVSSSLSDPLATYYEGMDSNTVIGAEIKSLSYLLHMRLIQSGVHIGVDSVDFDLYHSLGKLSARIAIGSDASFAVAFFIRTENSIDLLSSAKVFPNKLIHTESDIVLDCVGAAVLRRTRPLSEIDGFGVLTNIDGMMLEDMYYADI